VRQELLRTLCSGDHQLLVEVQALLDAEEMASAPFAAKQAAAPSLAGRRAGNYRMDGLIGSGGMGSVYLAHRCDGQFERQVALKVLGANLRDEFFTDRFALERQLLANLSHPNIATLLDSGISTEGDPYLVLEYVDGTRIDEYCDDRRLPVRDRLRLFQQICGAVEFAHSRRIIHRDLKPSNILVTQEGTVKLLDFGTAKLVEAADRENTSTLFRMLTPRYASPEQLRGDVLTASTDVYSLGVLLYELVTGAWPFGDSQSVIAGLERAVREVEPRMPGDVITDVAASARSTTKENLSSETGGDLWRVISKAIQSEPDRRYASPDDLAADLERFLKGISVHAPALRGRLRRWLVAGAIAGTLVLLSLGLFFLRPSPSAQPPASIAVLPFKNLSSDPQNRYFSDGLTDQISSALSKAKPLLVISRSSSFQFRNSAEDVRTIGKLLHATDVVEGSVALEGNRFKVNARLERSSDGAQIWSRVYERQEADLLALPNEIANDIASSLHAAAVAPSKRHVVNNQEAVDALMRAQFQAEQFTTESFDKAEVLLRRALALDPEYAQAYAALGATLINRSTTTVRDRAGRRKVLDEALPLYRKALELDPDLATPRSNLAGFLLDNDWDWARAESEYRRALAGNSNAAANTYYGLMLVYQGRFAEADQRLRMAEQQNPYSSAQMINIATARILEHRYSKAIEIGQDLLARSPKMASARSTINWARLLDGKADLVLADYDRNPEPGPIGKVRRAQVLAKLGRREEALALIRPMEADYQKFLPAISFAVVYAHLGDPQAIQWLGRSADDHELSVLYIGVDASFDRLRSMPGFQAILKRIGLAR